MAVVYPRKIPSVAALRFGLTMLNRAYDGKLQGSISWAKNTALDFRQLWGYLRSLRRNSAHSRFEKIQNLKTMLQVSREKKQRKPRAQADDASGSTTSSDTSLSSSSDEASVASEASVAGGAQSQERTPLMPALEMSSSQEISKPPFVGNPYVLPDAPMDIEHARW